MGEFDIDDQMWICYFPLTKKGQPIPVAQLLLQISEIEKTQTFFLQDSQVRTRGQPKDPNYVDQEAGFNDFVFLRNQKEKLIDEMNETVITDHLNTSKLADSFRRQSTKKAKKTQ